MSFHHPLALLLLPIVPALSWLMHRQPRPTIAWPEALQLVDLADRKHNWICNSLSALMLTAGILALAGPRWPTPGARLDDAGIAIMLVVDISGSMAEPDFEWNGEKIARLEAVKRSLRDFVKSRPQDRMGVVTFAAVAESASPLTRDHAALMQVIENLQPRGIPTESSTNLGDAVVWGLYRLRSETGRKLLVVISDGEQNVGAPALTPRQAGQLAAAAGVPVFTIFTGPDNGPGSKSLDSLANMTNGQAFAANNESAMMAAKQAVDEFERRMEVDPRRRRFTEAYPWLAMAALALGCGWFAYERGPGMVVP
jgi:Ca-activated chloride channel family protein